MTKKPWVKHYDQGVPESLEYPKITIQDLLDKAAKNNPDAACTIFKGEKISFSEMARITDRLAAGFHSIGIKKGDRIAVFIPNTPQFVMAYFALIKNPAPTIAEISNRINILPDPGSR